MEQGPNGERVLDDCVHQHEGAGYPLSLVCSRLQIPLFVVGKPGTSKTLSVTILRLNMTRDSMPAIYRQQNFPAFDFFPYQSSPLSTSEGILAVWAQGRESLQRPNSIPVVLLDEIGLAEQSPHNPLKVMHKVLVIRPNLPFLASSPYL